MRVRRWAFSSSGETIRHGLVFRLSPRVGFRSTRKTSPRLTPTATSTAPPRRRNDWRRFVKEFVVVAPSHPAGRLSPTGARPADRCDHHGAGSDSDLHFFSQAGFLDHRLGQSHPARVADAYQASLHPVHPPAV